MSQAAAMKQEPVLSAAEKDVLLDNLRLELQERCRQLRAQCELHAQGLRTRLEIRVNRIPRHMRTMKVDDLLTKSVLPSPASTGSKRPGSRNDSGTESAGSEKRVRHQHHHNRNRTREPAKTARIVTSSAGSAGSQISAKQLPKLPLQPQPPIPAQGILSRTTSSASSTTWIKRSTSSSGSRADRSPQYTTGTAMAVHVRTASPVKIVVPKNLAEMKEPGQQQLAEDTPELERAPAKIGGPDEQCPVGSSKLGSGEPVIAEPATVLEEPTEKERNRYGVYFANGFDPPRKGLISRVAESIGAASAATASTLKRAGTKTAKPEADPGRGGKPAWARKRHGA